MTRNGDPHSIIGAYTRRMTSSSRLGGSPGPDGLATPITMRSGVRVSATANPSRRNSGFQTRSTSGTGRGHGLEPRADVLGGPDRDRGLADHRAGPGQAGRQGADRGVDLAEVGGVRARVLRGADPDEVQVAEVRGLGEVRGEPQPSRGDVRLEQLGEPRLVEGDLAAGQGGDLVGVDVDTEDVVAGLGHRGGVGGTEVAGADDGDPQGLAHAGQPSAGSAAGTAKLTVLMVPPSAPPGSPAGTAVPRRVLRPGEDRGSPSVRDRPSGGRSGCSSSRGCPAGMGRSGARSL